MLLALEIIVYYFPINVPFYKNEVSYQEVYMHSFANKYSASLPYILFCKKALQNLFYITLPETQLQTNLKPKYLSTKKVN